MGWRLEGFWVRQRTQAAVAVAGEGSVATGWHILTLAARTNGNPTHIHSIVLGDGGSDGEHQGGR